MSQAFPFSQLPVELQHRIFDFVGADHNIVINQTNATTNRRLGDGLPPVSREFNALARPRILRSAPWSFSSYVAAQNFIGTLPGPFSIRDMEVLSIDVSDIDAPRLLDLLCLFPNFAPRCVTLERCEPQDFGVTPSREADGWFTGLNVQGLTALAGFAVQTLPPHLQKTICRGYSTNGIAGSALVVALRKVKSLRNVRVEISPCEFCTAGGMESDCEFHLLARKLEQFILLARVGAAIQPGQTRSLQNNLQAIEEEAQPLIQKLAWKEQAKAIGTDVGREDFLDFDIPDNEEAQTDSAPGVIGTDVGEKDFYDFELSDDELEDGEIDEKEDN